MTEYFADVVVDISHESVDRPFEYRIPEHLISRIEAGTPVIIPFGKGNNLRQGYILRVKTWAEYPKEKLKEIDSVVEAERGAGDNQLQLAVWMRSRYGATLIQCLKTVLPSRTGRKNQEKKELSRVLSAEDTRAQAEEAEQKNRVAMARILYALSEAETLPWDLVRDRLNVTMQTVTSLEKKGLLNVTSVRVYRNPVFPKTGRDEKKVLSEEQKTVVDTVLRDYDAGIRKPYLVHGITGSGKTEVYLQLLEGVLQRGKQAIVLIPEIALTYQTVMRFYKRFGDRVSVLHSGLSAGERFDQCERAKKGEVDIIIGPRSALFAPFENLGLIVIDEEHEPSYKSETMPRYHAREVAEHLCEISGASLILGSATPSLESYSAAQEGRYGYFTLTKRLTGNVLPEVYRVDLREELKAGNKSIFSRKLQTLMQDRLEKKEQTILFLNRRGTAGFVSCRSCGHVLKCPHCDVSLSEHRGGKMLCHYCGYSMPSVKRCPECDSPFIAGFKAGTEAVEDAVKKMFPEARVLRMDGDTTKAKDSYEKILSSFADREADILIGTQMIVKGHDFPGVTLVGILAADLSLFASDYRAGERTFQLLTQAAGRAGRGEVAGEVVIQTYQPEHYSIVTAAAQDYTEFARQEMVFRRMLHYPPAGHMLSVLVASPSEEKGQELAEDLADVAKRKGVTVLGPGKAGISKINDVFRFTFTCKSAEKQALEEAREDMEMTLFSLQRTHENVQFDFDPMNGF